MCIELFVLLFPYYSFDVCRVCSDIYCFIPDIDNLHLPFFSLCHSCQELVNCIHLFKEPSPPLIFSIGFVFSVLLISALYYLLLSACFAFSLLFFSRFLRWELKLLRPFLFSNVCIQCCKFPSLSCFSCSSQILLYCIFIFIYFNVFFLFPLRLPL